MSRMLRVSSSGYYAWQGRGPCARARKDETLTVHIKTIHRRSRGTYGVPRVHAELRDQGICVGRKRVAPLMRAAGLEGVSRRKGTRTTFRDRDARPVPNLGRISLPGGGH